MVDFDELLSYSTVKIVKIRDKRLGLLHYFFILVILLYIVGWTILYQKRYLAVSQPIGSVRTSLLCPEHRTPNPGKRLPPENLVYCKQHSDYIIVDGKKIPNSECQYWDETLALYPIVEDHDMFISTRVTSTSLHLSPENCTDMRNPACHYVPTGDAYVLYIADIEKFTILIDHSMYTPFASKNAQEIQGYLLDTSGKPVNLTKPNIIETGTSDILELGVILSAANVTLDSISNDKSDITKRYDGLVLLFFIRYTNMETYNQNDYKYYYSAKMIPSTKFKAVQPIYTKNLTKEETFDRHGVRIIFLQIGTIGIFDFQVMLISFVSGLGLLAVSTIIVDAIALYFLPHKKIYNKYKFETTEYIGVTPSTKLINDNVV